MAREIVRLRQIGFCRTRPTASWAYHVLSWDVEMRIREACVSDAESCSVVLCASIRELCIPDHRGDEDAIGRWLANKTPNILRRWIQSPRSTFYVSEVDDEITGVGAISDGEKVILNYVSPKHRFMGVSRAVLSVLEAQLRKRGVQNGRLTSTQTAHDFYRKAGWYDVAEPHFWLGIKGFPMRKSL